MPRAYHTLADLQGHLTHLDVRCSRCERRGRLRLERLIARYGPDAVLPTLRHTLAGDCLRREACEAERCDVYFPQLVGLFAGEERGGG